MLVRLALPLVALLLPELAHAQTTTAPTRPRPTTRAKTGLDWSYLYDGGAIPFVYGSAALAAGCFFLTDPPDSPRWFDPAEGGAEPRDEIIPTPYVIGFAGAATVGLGLVPSEARWYHVKGMAEALLTTTAMTEAAKNLFGRHRPAYDPATAEEDDRKSFFSGHSSITLATTVYLGLYLDGHVFAGRRTWEPLPLAALAAISVYVPYTRWADHSHHPSDILVGAGVGATTAALFYWWQERRFRSHATGEASSLVVFPDIRSRSVLLSFSF
jgi:membrane-associated phospholipid phosphatase